jgi:hypothetical protein
MKMNRILMIAALLVGLVGMGCNQDEKVREAQQTAAKEERQHVSETRRLDSESKGLDVDLVRYDFGEATANRYEKCIFDPPTQPANQAICKKLIDKVAKKKASDETAAKKW